MANTSALSTPVSINIPPSVISEIERTQGKPEELKMPDPVGPFGSGELNSVSDAPTVIDLGDGDIELKVNNTVFKSHKHLLTDFGRLKEMIKGMERYNTGAPCISIYRDERGVEDFKNMFKVLYATLVKGPFEFDTPILISSLRIATAYEYPELRKFSIDRLATASLSAIERIQLAREFDLTAWDESAFQELATREDPITKEEARELGFERFEELAKAREEEKRKKGAEDERVRREEEERKKREEEEAQRVREEEEKKKREEEEQRKREEEEKRQQEEQRQQEEEKKKREEEEEQARKEAEKKEAEKQEAEKKAAEEKARQEAEAQAAAAAAAAAEKK
ncbi:unnamed protein product [Rhizoctonia solani]|uniref:BTB domain-containing protein n=1 Tax=Rhizoctonia solani TaxID=456999 RepID=A0A8H3E6J9_9AGAM|nr:unnamed protein product [Rhizoctonia solani]CAE7229583.1 unnamed protein product [Rhizoctonia solani]